MEHNIIKQLNVIEKSTDWAKSFLEGEKQKNAYRTFVDHRRKLKKKKFALEGNPAAALYGESQVGKSYLISSLLSEKGKPFGIVDENNKFHNFIEAINPPGGGSESTSLVSRFSVNFKPINPKYPIKTILLSPADIVLVLCDSFYNDINIKSSHDTHVYSSDEISKEVRTLKEKYQNAKRTQEFLTEDEVLDMQDYFKDYFSIKADKVISSSFFDEIPLLISKTNPNEWSDIFRLLWNNNEIFSELFGSLISEYEKINFTMEAYLPIESVLYKFGTLLDVKRLKEIYAKPDKKDLNYKEATDILFFDENGQERVISFSKSYLCALSAELVFGQSESLLEKKPFLRETDLLDFPGARARMEKPVNSIETEIIPELLLRGKVAYLFNKYSDSEKINILLFCAKHEQTAQRIIPRMLNNWINKIIGVDKHKREQFIEQSQISPLFVISTFFNINLQYDPLLDKPDSVSHKNYRWNQRFVTTLAKEYFEKETYNWLESWTLSQPYFQNIFLLRDFAKSENPSNIYSGYHDSGEELSEVKPEKYPVFRKDLRNSFIEHEFVKKHFENPEMSWDEAANINKDGSQLIIDKLTIAAQNINRARREKAKNELKETLNEILLELKKYFHDGDKDKELQRAKSIAGDIQHKLDSAFRGDGIKLFGQLMREFIIDESTVYKLYREEIDNIDRRDLINLDIYNIYRMHVPVKDDDSSESYFERLCKHYEKVTEDQKEKFREQLEIDGVDIEELIKGSTDKIKNFSLQLAEALIEYWFVYVTQKEKSTIQQILSKNGSTALQEIVEMFQKLFKRVHLRKKISDSIKRYIDGYNKAESAYEMIADISAETMNKCINNIGLNYFSELDLEDLKLANEKNNLGLNLDFDAIPEVESVSDLFTKIDNLPQLIQREPDSIKTLPSYRNYIMWYDRLKIGFVSVCDIPNYDVAANEKLGKIIHECETIVDL